MSILVYHPATKKPFVKIGNTVFALVEPGQPGARFTCYLDNEFRDLVELFQSGAETEAQLLSEIETHITEKK
jgi:hypothetical protein